jgi:hypothetical protein
MPDPPRMGGHEIFGVFAEPGFLVSLAILAAFLIAFALLMLAVTGKL